MQNSDDGTTSLSEQMRQVNISDSSQPKLPAPQISTKPSIADLDIADSPRVAAQHSTLEDDDNGINRNASTPKDDRIDKVVRSANAPSSSPKPNLRISEFGAGISSPKASRSPASTPHSPSALPKTRQRQAPKAAHLEPSTFASLCLREELESSHGSPGTSSSPRTIVVLQDDCYGHRYARPKTTKANLNTIVERPERIHASLRGIASAYVRLSGRHEGGINPPTPGQAANVSVSAPFRFHKTSRRLPLRSSNVVAVHGSQWMDHLSLMCEEAEARLAAGQKELAKPSLAQNSQAQPEDGPVLHEGDLYLCPKSLAALEGSLGAVCEGIDHVFDANATAKAFVSIRPPGHHCSAHLPSGFCWVNNVHVGIKYATAVHGLTHAAIIDFDLHHGDGSQAITWDHNARVRQLPKNASMTKKTAIGYFSLHDINSYPCEMGDEEKVRSASLCIENAHGQNIWNVHLDAWKTEAEFWSLYKHKYSVIIAKARSFLRAHTARLRSVPTHPTPKAAIFLSAGFDASEWESPHMQRHNVKVPTDFYARFTRDITKMAEEQDLGVDGRIISVLEGGYSDRALTSGVMSHMVGLVQSDDPSRPASRSRSRNIEMTDHDSLQNNVQGTKTAEQDSMQTTPLTQRSVSPSSTWWSANAMQELENLINPPLVPKDTQKKIRSDARATSYTSTTQSYSAKIVAPTSERRAVSNSLSPTVQVSAGTRECDPNFNFNSLPAPSVHWTIAAVELSKLLIPTDRETRSHKPEELSNEAARIRRATARESSTLSEKQISPEAPMQLREKRTRAAAAIANTAGPATFAKSETGKARVNRRRTLADVTALDKDLASDPKTDTPPKAVPTVPATEKRITSSANLQSGGNSDVDQSPSKPSMKSVAAAKLLDTAIESSMPTPALIKPKISRRGVGASESLGRKTNSKTQTGPSPSETAAKTPTSADTSIDGLASGMRQMSIKLNVPSREECEARLQSKTQMPKLPKLPTESKPLTKRSTTSGSRKPASPTKTKVRDSTLKKDKIATATMSKSNGPSPLESGQVPALPKLPALQHQLSSEAVGHDGTAEMPLDIITSTQSGPLAPPSTDVIITEPEAQPTNTKSHVNSSSPPPSSLPSAVPSPSPLPQPLDPPISSSQAQQPMNREPFKQNLVNPLAMNTIATTSDSPREYKSPYSSTPPDQSSKIETPHGRTRGDLPKFTATSAIHFDHGHGGHGSNTTTSKSTSTSTSTSTPSFAHRNSQLPASLPSITCDTKNPDPDPDPDPESKKDSKPFPETQNDQIPSNISGISDTNLK